MGRDRASPLVTARPTAESFAVLDVAGMNYARRPLRLDSGRCSPTGSSSAPRPSRPASTTTGELVQDNPHVIGDFTWTGLGLPRRSRASAASQYADEREAAPSFGRAVPVARSPGAATSTSPATAAPSPTTARSSSGCAAEPYIAVQRPEHYGTAAAMAAVGLERHASPAGPGTRLRSAPIKVEVYSDADEVELLLNGSPVGRVPAGPDHRFRAEFELTYEPGELVADRLHRRCRAGPHHAPHGNRGRPPGRRRRPHRTGRRPRGPQLRGHRVPRRPGQPRHQR